jgi:SRSO17 transposase
MERYVTGLLTDLPHKTCETIADVVAGTSLERLQYLLTDAAWDPAELDEARVKRLLALHPVSSGILILDDTGLPKKGSASVGVFPQYSGTLGKIGNCQVVVSAEFLADDPASSSPFHWPVSAQLFLPEAWVQDAERRKQAQVPESMSQETRPTIALGLLDRARQWGVPVGLVVVDAGYGDNPNFLQGLDARQVPYVCAVESTFGCRLPREVQAKALEPPVRSFGRGQPRKPRPAPLYTAKELMDALPASAWRIVTFREGTKGTMQVQAVAIRVHWATGSALHSTSHSRVQTGPEGWLVAERPLPGADPHEQETPPEETSGKKPEHTNYRFSTLPPDTSLERLVLLAHARWVIEQWYEDAKQECGFDHFQGRSWNGLHRHLALVMLAYSFLMLHRLTLPSDEAFSPLRQAKLAAWRASPDAALVVPGSRPVAAPHPAGRVLPPQKKLTE